MRKFSYPNIFQNMHGLFRLIMFLYAGTRKSNNACAGIAGWGVDGKRAIRRFKRQVAGSGGNKAN